MCGIAGFISTNISDPKEILYKMINQLKHRGPDNTSIYHNKIGMGMAHSRLSIIDLSKKGLQPIHSKSGRYIIAFNGEIYNYKHLKKEIDNLKNIQWSGSSDSEVLTEIIDYYGIKDALIKTKGMFAISVWDNKEKILTLCRDRMGEKPLYYGWQNNSFIFASELKSLQKFPGFKKEIANIPLVLIKASLIP